MLRNYYQKYEDEFEGDLDNNFLVYNNENYLNNYYTYINYSYHFSSW